MTSSRNAINPRLVWRAGQTAYLWSASWPGPLAARENRLRTILGKARHLYFFADWGRLNDDLAVLGVKQGRESAPSGCDDQFGVEVPVLIDSE
jgi:hypothetical protein